MTTNTGAVQESLSTGQLASSILTEVGRFSGYYYLESLQRTGLGLCLSTLTYTLSTALIL
jgi:hypothetical protein